MTPPRIPSLDYTPEQVFGSGIAPVETGGQSNPWIFTKSKGNTAAGPLQINKPTLKALSTYRQNAKLPSLPAPLQATQQKLLSAPVAAGAPIPNLSAADKGNYHSLARYIAASKLGRKDDRLPKGLSDAGVRTLAARWHGSPDPAVNAAYADKVLKNLQNRVGPNPDKVTTWPAGTQNIPKGEVAAPLQKRSSLNPEMSMNTPRLPDTHLASMTPEQANALSGSTRPVFSGLDADRSGKMTNAYAAQLFARRAAASKQTPAQFLQQASKQYPEASTPAPAKPAPRPVGQGISEAAKKKPAFAKDLGDLRTDALHKVASLGFDGEGGVPHGGGFKHDSGLGGGFQSENPEWHSKKLPQAKQNLQVQRQQNVAKTGADLGFAAGQLTMTGTPNNPGSYAEATRNAELVNKYTGNMHANNNFASRGSAYNENDLLGANVAALQDRKTQADNAAVKQRWDDAAAQGAARTSAADRSSAQMQDMRNTQNIGAAAPSDWSKDPRNVYNKMQQVAAANPQDPLIKGQLRRINADPKLRRMAENAKPGDPLYTALSSGDDNQVDSWISDTSAYSKGRAPEDPTREAYLQAGYKQAPAAVAAAQKSIPTMQWETDLAAAQAKGPEAYRAAQEKLQSDAQTRIAGRTAAPTTQAQARVPGSLLKTASDDMSEIPASRRKLPYRKAARIILENDKGEILAKTNPKYIELPGGGIDPGESPETAARRELLEEVGYTAGDLELVLHTKYDFPSNWAQNKWGRAIYDDFRGSEEFIFRGKAKKAGKATIESDAWTNTEDNWMSADELSKAYASKSTSSHGTSESDYLGEMSNVVKKKIEKQASDLRTLLREALLRK